MWRLFPAALFVICAHATVVDRIAITIGRQVITEQQLDEELRVTSFLNHEEISRTLDARRSAADHLIEQLLVRREMEISHYPDLADEDVENYLAEVRATFASPDAFSEALAQYDLTASVLKEHLALQLTTLRFIEFRFRPDTDISKSQIEASYERQVTAWKAKHPGEAPPSVVSSRDAIRKALLEQRTDEVLNAWLEESRKQINIVYLDKTLQ